MKLTFILLIFIAVFVAKNASAQDYGSIQTISLDGKWDIIVDSQDIGLGKAWQLNGNFEQQSQKRKIDVPSCWEEMEQDYEGVAFYRRKFTIPASWKDRTIELQFDAVNYKAEVWLNDQVVGFHEGGFTPFSFKVHELVKPGEENILVMRVVGPILLTDQRIDGMGRQEVPQWRGAITGGIWQHVRIKAMGEVLVDDVVLETKISNNSVSFETNLEYTGYGMKESKIEIEIRNQSDAVVGKLNSNVTLEPGKNTRSWTFEISDAKHWSPDNPYLYKVQLNASIDEILSDSWSQKFGIREFTIKDKQFVLNGKPIYLKATFFEGLYPVKLAYPDSKEMAIKEIMLAKEAGFNMIRPWRKPPPPMWLDLCDSIGMMTIGSLAIECMSRPLSSPYLAYRVENELRQSIIRDRNRTCVVQWELFNELHRPVLKQMLRPMSLLARELDPTRLILDESGGFADGASLYLPYEKDLIKFNDIHYYTGSQVNENIYNNLFVIGNTDAQKEALGLGHVKVRANTKHIVPGLMSVISELGYGSLPNLPVNIEKFKTQGNPLVPALRYHQRIANDTKVALKKTGLDKVYPDLEEFCLEQQKMHGLANKRMIEATRVNTYTNGYCIHALVGGDWVLGAGLLDMWRNPKTDVYYKTKEANQAQIVSIRVLPRNVYAEKGTTIQVFGVNDLEAFNGSMSLKVVSEKGKTVFHRNLKTSLSKRVNELFKEAINTTKLKGTYTVKVDLKDSKGKVLTSNETTFDVFTTKQLIAPKAKVAVLEADNKLSKTLNNAGVEYVKFSSELDKSIPVVVGSIAMKQNEFKAIMDEVNAFVNEGGKAIYLQMPAKAVPISNRVLKPNGVDNLPYSSLLMRSEGLWINKPHIVTNHPVFKGLPTELIMHGVYENIHPKHSLMMQEGEYIAGCIAYDWFTNKNKMLRHYNGPGEVWYAADVLLANVGEGKMLLSTLEILDNLGEDPVAEKVLFNMIEFLDK